MSAPGQWSLASTAPNAAADPAQLDALALTWIPAIVPGTVAQSLRAAGLWDFDHIEDFDDRDWWYRTTIDGAPFLHLDGLATLAEVWLNGSRVLESSNMFQRHSVDVRAHLQSSNELVLCFRSLNAALAQRRPRPRWKTKLVKHQQLRWFRTSLLGRMPGWTPPVAPVGPWRDVSFGEARPRIAIRTSVHGSVEMSCVSDAQSGELRVGETHVALHADRGVLRGKLQVENPQLWWPHTHGESFLYDCAVTVDDQTIDCGPIGFRGIEALQDDGGFTLRVNGEEVFCRGVCWTSADIVSLNGDPRESLTRFRDAGANMIRVGGTMVYESDAFYRACDELGLLVWQDFMFANMDYPAGDAQFVANVRAEATQEIERLAAHPCVAVYCGNSEVEQQAAMVGAPRELWRNALFAEVLPELCASLHPGSVYVPSTPSGGALPFHTGTGVTHYYGVGAYLRPLTDARRANVRFTPECLGFANVPAQAVIDDVMQGDSFALHDPRWKRRTPRDVGAAWDFEDVRDHYLGLLFGVDPVQLRSFDSQRYLELSRIVTGEVMAQVFSEWRSTHSACGGGLVWFARDFWPGAGWGVLDSRGIPKACFHALKRVWQPQTVVITDEGLDGLHLHVINESADPLCGTLELLLLRDGHAVVAQASVSCDVSPRSKQTFVADAMLGGFYDVAYAYRFGPPSHDVSIATLFAENGSVLAEAFHFPHAIEPRRMSANVTASAARVADDLWHVTIESDRFLRAVHIDADGLLADDDDFHLTPRRARNVLLRGNVDKPQAFLAAINLEGSVRIGVRA
ncbi:MAG: glycoside hydrolase family 2 protein [Acidobacteriota bacterium]|nr:glycoside hydrolase family 2 protein [Acidobacteriota bacterium]